MAEIATARSVSATNGKVSISCSNSEMASRAASQSGCSGIGGKATPQGSSSKPLAGS
ncbi:MAG TPA: hypothetical protein VE684_05460 [Crenalkalicoccus sp.]|nr:hypothetical protein [Crenalkalicoccus sp.]